MLIQSALGGTLSAGLLSLLIYGHGLSFSSPILPGLEFFCESVMKDWAIERFSSGLGPFINYLHIFKKIT